MKHIFVNLKRFEVPRELGGVCDQASPRAWIEDVITDAVHMGLGALDRVKLTFLLPEALLIPAVDKLTAFSPENTANLSIGCQGVYREDIRPGGNFGAFTACMPAAAAGMIGCKWSIIGHSEERKNLEGIMDVYRQHAGPDIPDVTARSVNDILNREVSCAAQAGLKVLYCVGETAADKGSGPLAEQVLRSKAVISRQLAAGLQDAFSHLSGEDLVIGYEPIWAIGPGKTPPGPDYIKFIADFIKEELRRLYGVKAAVVYGGGLKEENAGAIAGIDTIDGGLVALTRFQGNIGFYPEDLKRIMVKYLENM